MSMRHLFLLGLLLQFCLSFHAIAGVRSPQQTDLHGQSLSPNGVFRIQALTSSGWVDAGKLGFSRWPVKKELSLKDVCSDSVCVIRLTQSGGGASHVDQLLINGQPPTVVTGVVETDPAGLVAKEDHNLLHATDTAITCRFDNVQAPALLTLLARIETIAIPGVPFKFPMANQRLARDQYNFFYDYHLSRSDSEASVLFSGQWDTASGHPSGIISARASHCRDFLRLKLDFSPDNTLDGDKDWAAVHIQTPSGVRTFRCSQAETQWGQPSFTTSHNAPWLHKVYDFVIPLADIEVPETDKPLKLAFSAYGTATTYGDSAPALAYDTEGRRGLLVYRHGYQVPFLGGGTIDMYEIRGRWLNSLGIAGGQSFRIDAATTPSAERYHPDVAFDAVNNRYLVVWSDSDTGSYHVYGRIFSPDFSYDTGVFTVSNADDSMYSPVCAWSDSSRKYLVVWYDDREASFDDEIFFRTLSAEGVVEGTVDQKLSDNGEHDRYPQLVFNSDNNTFFVVWNYESSETEMDVFSARVSDEGALVGTPTAVSIDSYNQINPAVAADPDRGQVMVCWADDRYGYDDHDIWARLAYSNGSMKGDKFSVSLDLNNQIIPEIAYSKKRDQYLVAWSDNRVTNDNNYQLYASTIEGDSTMAGLDFALYAISGNMYLGDIAVCGGSGHFSAITQYWEAGYPNTENVSLRTVLYPGFMPTGALQLLLLQ